MALYHLNLIKDYRGGERQTELLVQALAGLGMQQTIILRKGSVLAAHLRHDDKLRVIEIGKPFIKSLAVLRGADLIHAHDAQASQLAFMANRLLGKRYIITRRIPNRPKNNPFTRRVYRRAQLIVALSDAIKTVIEAYEPEVPMQVIPSMTARFSVDWGEVARIRRLFTGHFLVGQVGALVMHHKGQQHLIAAAGILHTKAPDMVFLLVGDGKDEAALRRLAAGMPNVRFMGYQENVADYLASLDVLVFPSLHEGLGSTLLDAMDLGIPVIASRVGGIPEIIRHEHNGLLIPPGDAHGIAAALLRLSGDPELRAKFAAEGRRAVTSYRPDKIARRYVDVYRRLGIQACASP